MIKQVPTYAKFLKDLCTIKRGLNVNKKAFLAEQASAIIQCKSPMKYKEPGCPTISVMIRGIVVEKVLLDLGATWIFVLHQRLALYDGAYLLNQEGFLIHIQPSFDSTQVLQEFCIS